MKNLLSLIFLLTVSITALTAQSGTVRGRLTDELGLPLPGSNAYIDGLEAVAVSDIEGEFILLDIPLGSHKLVVKYIGYQTLEQTIEVSAGQTTELDLSMSPGVLLGQEVLVLGDRLKGQAKALNQQKNNMNVTNIVAADQIGRFPDANIGDAVKRIPGITMQGDQGEARNIVVRGMAPQLNSVMINGDRVPSAEGDNRNIQMDLIPADMIQTIEVNKAVTPDMDADAIGGAVNLVTRPAPNGFRLSATAASGVNLLTEKPIWTGSMILGNRFANNKLGVLVSATINDHDFGSDNMEAEWEREVEIDGEDVEVDPYITDLEIRQYLVRRTRRSVSGSVDYRIDANNVVIARAMYNWRDDWENRFRKRLRKIEPLYDNGLGGGITSWEGEIERETKGGIGNDRNDNRRLEDQRVRNFSLSGDHLFGSLRMTWMASWSRASEERLNERYINYVLPDAVPMNVNLANPEFPEASALNASDVTLGQFEFDELTEENQYTEDEDFNTRLDFELPVTLGNRAGFLKVGGRARLKTKFRDNNFFEFSPIDEDAIATLDDVPTKDYTKDNFLPGDFYDAGLFADETYLGGLDLDNASAFEAEAVPDEFLPVNYQAEENIYGGYLMWSQALSDKLSMLAGVRVEATDISYIGNSIQFLEDEILIEPAIGTDNYVNVLPGLHFKYNFTDNSMLRAAWTNTLARPNYYDLVPYRNLVEGDEEIFQGNPDLDPTTSMNFDLMFEQYFSSVGVISAGAFYKSVNDFIYVSQTEDPNTGYDFFQPRNGGDADVTGFEIAFQRQLDFLPGIWKGLGVYVNYTFLSSNATGVANEDGDVREDLDLPGTAPHMLNASLSYENKRLVLRASLNFADAYIDEVGGNAFYDRYYDSQLFVDVNGSYAFTPEFRFFFEMNNLTNQPLRYYQGVASRTMQTEYYNARFNAGVKYDLFKRK
jgi:TonB-dependent receptor